MSTAPSGRLTAGNIINSVGLEPAIAANASINLALRTSIDLGDGTPDGLPSIIGVLHVSWDFDTDNPDLGVPTVTFDQLWLNAGTFASEILGPIVTQVRKVTSPLEPIVDFIRSEVPILTQLAEIVGAPPVTVLSLIKLSGGFDEDDLDLIDSVLQVITLANSLPANTPTTFIPLGASGPGSFELLGDRLLQGPTTPHQAQTLIAPGADAGTDLAVQLPGNEGSPGSRPGTFGVEGLTFPFLDNATEIFGLLLGQDVTIVRMDFGAFKASVSEGYEFGPIFIGPFPVTAEVSISFIGEARFAMGYDTRGLRLVVDGGDATKLFNGIFTQTSGIIQINGDSSLDLMVADLTGNGKLDVVTVQGESGNFQNRIYINSGPADTHPPRIIRTEQVQDTEDTAGPYIIRALILDNMSSDRNFLDKGIALHYSVNGGVRKAVPMRHSGGQVYRGALPGQPECSTLEYWVTAIDFNNNTGTGETQSFTVGGGQPGDLDGDCDVDAADLAQLLGAWRPYEPCPPFLPADLDQDCTVGAFDLAILLGKWGP